MFFYGEEFGFRGEQSSKVWGEVNSPRCIELAQELNDQELSEEEIDAFLDTVAETEHGFIVQLCSAIVNGYDEASKNEAGVWTFFGEDCSLALGADKKDARSNWCDLEEECQ